MKSTIRIAGPAGPEQAEPQGLRAVVRRFRRNDASSHVELPGAYRPLEVTGPPGSGFTIIGVRRQNPASR
jgi:hypothetical protein